MERLEKCCQLEDIKVIFILFGDILNIPDIIGKIEEGGKMAVVHVDLINGLSSRECGGFYKEQHQGGRDQFH